MGKRGPKPKRGEAKVPYSTKLAREHVDFLQTLPSAAKWLEKVIDRQGSFKRWREEAKR